MIFKANNVHLDLGEYGITIPLFELREKLVLEKLLSNSGYMLHRSEWLKEEDVETALLEDLHDVHDRNYIQMFSKNPGKAIKLAYELLDNAGNFNRYDPLKQTKGWEEFRDQLLLAAGGVYRAMEIALQEGFCFYLNSYAGAHHAMSYGGRGFCVINDIVVGLKKMMKQEQIKKAWVIDVDAHKGDGTAELTQEDSSIRTLSIHMAEGWPLDEVTAKQDPLHKLSLIESDIDIAVYPEQQDLYLSKLAKGLSEMIDFGEPDLVVVVNGSDPYEHDTLEGSNLLSLNKDQMLKRDQYVYNFIEKIDAPQVWLMAGGYGPRSYEIYLQFLEWQLSRG